MIIGKYGREGWWTMEALRWAIERMSLEVQVVALSEFEAREVLRSKQGKVGASFTLSATHWQRFVSFFQDNPHGVLTHAYLSASPDTGESTAHAVVVEDLSTVEIHGVGTIDGSQTWALKNSWSADQGDVGVFHVHRDALELDMFHLQRKASAGQLSLEAAFSGASPKPTDLTQFVSLDGGRKAEGSHGYVVTGTLRVDVAAAVAVKVAKNGRQELLLNEMMVLLRLQGTPNIVRMLGVMREPDGQHWACVMQHYPKDLGRRYPFAMSAHIALDVALALAAVHALGYIHGDVKETNILLDESGRAVRAPPPCAAQPPLWPHSVASLLLIRLPLGCKCAPHSTL